MYEGRLVRLRAMEPADAERMHRWINDPETRAHLDARYPFSLGKELDWIESNKDVRYDRCNLAVDTLSDHRHIGLVDIRTTDHESRCAELGLMIGEKALWGQGYGTDLVRTACRFGFEEMNLHRVELWVHGDNDRGRRVYESVGFVTEGVAREGFYKRGRYTDKVLMGLLRKDFRPGD